MNVDVLEHPQLPSASDIGPDLLGFFRSIGMRPSWQRLTEETEYQLSAVGIRVFRVSELKNDKDGNALYESVVSLYHPNDEGHIRRADCALCLQPVGLHQQYQAADEARRKMRESGERATEAVKNMMEKEAVAGGINPKAMLPDEINIPDPEPIVASGPETAEIVVTGDD